MGCGSATCKAVRAWCIFKVSGKRGKVRFVPVHAMARRLIEEYLAAPGHGGDTAGPVLPSDPALHDWSMPLTFDRSRRPDQFGYVVAVDVRHPDVARAVDRHGPWVVKVRPGGGKVAFQRPVGVQGGYGPAYGVRDPDVARAVDRHGPWVANVR